MAEPVANHQVGWRAILSAAATDMVAILPGFMTAGLAVQIRDDIGLTLSSLGASLLVFFGAAALTSAPAGRFVERRGWATSLRLAAVLAGSSSLAVGWLVESVAALYGVFVVAGVASALAHPAANLTVARCTPVARHGFFFGLKHAAVPTSTLLAGIAVPAVALTVGWRWAFIGGALLAAAAGLAVPRRESAYEVNPPQAAGKPTAAQVDVRLLVWLAFAVGFGIAGVDALASFTVTYAVDIGMAESSAGLVLAAGSVAGIVTRLVAGWMIDRRREADLAAVAALLVAGAAGITIMNIVGRPGLLLGGLLAFSAGWGWSGLFTFAVVRMNPTAPATATGITQAGKLVGAGFGPAAFGILADRISYNTAWWTITAMLVTSAVMMLLARGRDPQGGEIA